MVLRKLGTRYLVFDEIASGGMANVHYGIARGQGGFRRVVAVKRLHESWAKDPEFAALFLDEARMTSRVQHPNVVSILDVVEDERELFIVMEYVPGAPLSQLAKLSRAGGHSVPEDVAVSLVAGVLAGLHAAHEARNDRGEPLEIVHRDVSPQNVLVGTDGLAKVVDFGIAKAVGRSTTTRDGRLKGKLAYMAPEQLLGQPATRQSDVWSASVVLWELLAARRLFAGASEGEIVAQITQKRAPRLEELVPDIRAELARVVMQGLARDPEKRFTTARAMALALEEAMSLASAARVGAWVESLAGDALAARARRVHEIESEAATLSDATDATPPPIAPASAVAVTDARAPSRPRRIASVALVVSLAVSALALAFLFARSQTPMQVASSEPTRPSAAPLVTAPSAAASTETSRPAPSGSSAPSASATPRAAAPQPKPGPARGKSKPPNCYRQDAEGIWHIKPECL